ncbi:hypothetical protein KI811_03245 [Geobacter hydrogenophilus]|uniref:hypothetical protein n=1 Tax=Geobacter hydrogenophilus TaxID=40983 RepID=UPI002490F8C6|nr:hypothetical protein [Geobacter hydrogenophilus]MBT0892840.1 hypothetical protein [Geobacter hydrogenophilus]
MAFGTVSALSVFKINNENTPEYSLLNAGKGATNITIGAPFLLPRKPLEAQSRRFRDGLCDGEEEEPQA